MAICGVIGNCDDWPDIALFAQKREGWFQRFLNCPAAFRRMTPSSACSRASDPRAFSAVCLAWLRDGRRPGRASSTSPSTARRCAARPARQLGALHLVSAWATEAHLTLGQVAVDGKSNEITAIPQLLALLDLNGALVTIDAIGCQKAIAKQIVAGGGDYVLVVKGNQERLLEDIQADGGRRPWTANCRRARCDSTRRGRRVTAAKKSARAWSLQHVAGIRDRKAWPG